MTSDDDTVVVAENEAVTPMTTLPKPATAGADFVAVAVEFVADAFTHQPAGLSNDINHLVLGTSQL
jgi:hypothetical protein